MDGNLDPPTQTKQLQDAITSGKYDGIVLQPVYGAALVPGAQAAIAKGIAVGNIDQILGTDFTTADAQVTGLSRTWSSWPAPGQEDRRPGHPGLHGQRRQPCKIGYIFSVKAAGLDQELRKAFDAEIAGNRTSRSSPRASPSTRRRPVSRPPRTCSRPTPTST